MSELNVAAVLTPKPENFDEVRMILYNLCVTSYLSAFQVAALVTEVTKQVQEHEPDTLLYYAFQDKKEIIIVERSVIILSSVVASRDGEHPFSFTWPHPSPCLGSDGRSRKTRHQDSVLTPDQIQEPGGGQDAHHSPLFPRVLR